MVPPLVTCGVFAAVLASGIGVRSPIASAADAPAQRVVQSDLALGRPATRLRELSLGAERPYLVVAEHSELGVVAANRPGGPALVGRIALQAGTDAADAQEIASQPDGSSSPWAADLLVSVRANARIIRLHHAGARWQDAGSLPAGAAPTTLFRGGVVDSGSDAVSVYEPRDERWQPRSDRARHVRVAEQDGVRLGFAVLLERAGFACELDGLFVEPDRMRTGVGRRLIEDAMQVARSRGATRIDVVANPQAVAFYEAVGFTTGGAAQTRFGPAPRRRC